MPKDVTILVADPNPHIRQFLKRELMGSGYLVFEATNYDEIFYRISGASPPKLIIFDLNLPYSGGLDALKRLHSLIPPIPTIIYSDLTEYENHPDIQRAEAFIEKNDDPSVLFDTVSDVIQKYYRSYLSP